jgi:hypothetical protein
MDLIFIAEVGDRDFVDEVPPENGNFLISGILLSIFGNCVKLLWIG